MAYPITLSINLADYADAVDDQASISFQLSGVMYDSGANKVISPKKESPALTNGAGTISLPATKNDPDISPTGLTYKVRLINPTAGIDDSWEIELDKALGPNQNLADLPPATHTITATYASVATVNSHIAATEDVHGIVDTAQLATLSDLAGVTPEWGHVTGTLAEQTDLATALAAKLDTSTYNAFTPNVNRSPVLVVASSTASAKERALADYACDGTADDVQIQAAISALGAAGGTIMLTSGVYRIAAKIVLPSLVEMRGRGIATTILQQAAGANLECVIQSANYAALLVSRVWYVQDGNNYGFGLYDLMIDGNQTSQTGGTGGGAQIYGKWFTLRNVQFAECRGIGLRTEGGNQFGPITKVDTEEGRLDNVYCMRNGGDGWYNNGPHDAVVGYFASGRNGGRGLYVTSSGNFEFDVMHIYGNTGHGLQIEGQILGGFLGIDSNYGTGLWLKGNKSIIGTIYGWTPGIGNQPTHIMLDGNDNIIGDSLLETSAGDGGGASVVAVNGTGNRFAGHLLANLPATAHVALGASALDNAIDAVVTATQAQALSIASGATNNRVRINARVSGSATHWDGAGSDANAVEYLSNGADSKSNGTAVILSANTAVTVTHGLVRAPALSEIQVTPVNNLGSAAKFWVSNLTSTTFSINVDVAPGASLAKFAWRAELATQANAALTLVTESFTGTTGTALASHTADTGLTWTDDTAGIQLNGSGAARTANAGPTLSHLVAGVSDGTFSLSINLGTDTGTTTQARHAYLVYRFQDNNNFWAARLRRSADGTIHDVSLFKWVAGVSTQVWLDNTQTVAASTAYTLSVVASGNTHIVKLNGTTLTTQTDSALATQTGAGVRMRYESASEPAGFTVDNFSVSA